MYILIGPWLYEVKINEFIPEKKVVPCQDHDDPEFSDPGTGPEVSFTITTIFPREGEDADLNEIASAENLESVILDHLSSQE